MLAAQERQFPLVKAGVQSLEAWNTRASHQAATAARLAIAKGTAKVAGHEQDEGIRLLRRGIDLLRPSGEASFFLGGELLANALVKKGETSEAIRVLEEGAREKERAYPLSGSTGLFWIRARARLAQLYRRAWREQEASAIEAELLKLLAYADPDYPLLVELKARQQARAVKMRQPAPKVATVRTLHQ